MENQRKRIVCNTYGTIYQKFKEICVNKYACSVNDRISYLIDCYVSEEITMKEIQDAFIREKVNLNEKKDTQITLRIDSDLYERLTAKLKKDQCIRPGTFISLVMGYFVSKNDYPEMEREWYSHKAQLLLDQSDDTITHVVYGLRYFSYEQESKQWIFLNEKHFLHVCTEEEFKEFYLNTPVFQVLAVHR